MEVVGVFGELLPQLVVLLLANGLLGQLAITLLDDLLQVAPGIFESLHGEPGVRVLSDVEAFDLLVQLGEGLEVDAGGRERGLELVVSLAQRLDLLDRVAANWIGHVLLGVLEPGVEGRSLFGEGQEEVLDLAELILNLEETKFSVVRIRKKFLPTRYDLLVLPVDGGSLVVAGLDELIHESRDVLNSFVFESLKADVESFLLSQQSLNGGEVSSEVGGLDVGLLVGDPGLDDVGLPHELKVGRVVEQVLLPDVSKIAQIVHLVAKLKVELQKKTFQILIQNIFQKTNSYNINHFSFNKPKLNIKSPFGSFL